MKVKCAVSGNMVESSSAYRGSTLRPPLFEMIHQDFQDFTEDSYISQKSLIKYRKRYLQLLLSEEAGELNSLQNKVIDAISNNEVLSRNIEPDIDEPATIGQRMADKIASFGGSWTFIIFFFAFLFLWMMLNVVGLLFHTFDPYPFILLNLILSCLAAIQAPVIMMSQNRKEQKDRIRSENDYMINLKAELEIKLLHEKIDHLVSHQNQRLLEIQELQSDYLEDILNAIRKGSPSKKE